MKDFTALALGALFGVVITLVYRFADRLVVLDASLLCAPSETTVGRPVQCVDLTIGADFTVLMGPDGPVGLNRGAAQLVFSRPGEHVVRLHAVTRAGSKASSTETTILVTPRAPIEPPLALSLAAPPDDDAVITQAHAVDEAWEGAPDRPTQRSVVRRWPAREGYRIARIRMEQMRMTGLGALSAKVVEDGAAAELSFTLRAGTPARPGDARLIARIVLEQTPLAAADGPIAAPVRIDAEGLWSFPGSWPEPPETLLLLDEDGAVLGEGPPGATLAIRGRPYAVTVSPADGVTLLDVRRIGPDAQ